MVQKKATKKNKISKKKDVKKEQKKTADPKGFFNEEKLETMISYYATKKLDVPLIEQIK